MCYSAMVNQSCKNLGMSFEARVDLDLMKDLFQRRANGEKLVIPKGLEFNFRNSGSPKEREISDAIEAFRSHEASNLETELFALKTRLAVAEKKLATKFTKTADREKDVVLRQIDRKRTKLENIHRQNEIPTDNRIYPFSWTSVIVNTPHGRSIVPMRYHLRPPGKPPQFDSERPGCYNARRDNLQHFWKKQFGHKHGLIVISSFFENVSKHTFEKRELKHGEKEENLILQFSPTGQREMYVPIIWDSWSGTSEPGFDCFAMITDEPPQEVSDAGHDRCPIFIKQENIEAWLRPEGKTQAQLFSILDDRVRPIYKHQIAA